MRHLAEYLNEQNNALIKILSGSEIITNDNGDALLILIQLKNPSDSNVFPNDVYGGSCFYVPKHTKDSKNPNDWSVIKFGPTTGNFDTHRSRKLNESIIKKLKAEKIKSISFKGSGFPHSGPVFNERSVEYEAIYYKFDPTELIKHESELDDNYYVNGHRSAVFGIVSIDKEVIWNEYHKFLGK